MPSEGDLFIITENVTLDRHETAELSIQSGDYVCISVTDNGIGMDKEIVQNIFDPFFTTKNDKAAKILDRGCDRFIQKPFDVDKLSRRIRDIFKRRWN